MSESSKEGRIATCSMKKPNDEIAGEARAGCRADAAEEWAWKRVQARHYPINELQPIDG